MQINSQKTAILSYFSCEYQKKVVILQANLDNFKTDAQWYISEHKGNEKEDHSNFLRIVDVRQFDGARGN